MHIYCIALTIFFPLFVLILVDLSKELMFSIHYAYFDPYNGTFFSLRDHSSRSRFTKISSSHATSALIYYRDKPLKLNARVGLLARGTMWGTDTSDTNGSFQQCAKI